MRIHLQATGRITPIGVPGEVVQHMIGLGLRYGCDSRDHRDHSKSNEKKVGRETAHEVLLGVFHDHSS